MRIPKQLQEKLEKMKFNELMEMVNDPSKHDLTVMEYFFICEKCKELTVTPNAVEAENRALRVENERLKAEVSRLDSTVRALLDMD